MSTSTFVRTGLVANILLMMLFSACNNNPTPPKPKASLGNSENIAKEYDIAAKRADENNPKGFLEIYRISSEGKSAEISEIARDKLCWLLYKKEELWIKTFSKIDFSEFKKYLESGGLAPIDLPNGIASQEQYLINIQDKLKSNTWNGEEQKLVDYILSLKVQQ